MYDAGDNLVNHDGIEHAGYLSFVLLLAFFPFLVFFVAILGSLGETQTGASFVNAVLGNLPQHIIGVVKPRIEEILSGPPVGLFTISILGTIWTASSMIEGFRTILNRAYRVHTPPNYYLRRALSILQLIILIVILIAAMLVLVFLPVVANKVYGFFDAINAISDRPKFEYQQISFLGVEWEYIRKLLALSVMFFFISSLYYFLPNVKQSWVRTIPGALVAAFGWVLAGVAFSFYLGNFNQVNLIYGSLGSIIAFLLFFYVVNIIFIYGAEFNYLLEELRGVKVVEREKSKEKANVKKSKRKR